LLLRIAADWNKYNNNTSFAKRNELLSKETGGQAVSCQEPQSEICFPGKVDYITLI
jgi:hypothetical protein